MHGAVGWKDNGTECITMNNNIIRQTQLSLLTLILPNWRIWWAPNNASKWL